jgi:hypothetical protein
MEWSQKIPTKYILGTVAALAIAGVMMSEPPPKTAISVAGYFKDQAQQRIYSQIYTPATSSTAIRAHANTLMHTKGSMTAAYYYPSNAQSVPRDALTLAKNIHAANHLMYEKPGLSQWHYAYMKDRRGNITLVDCQTTPQHDLCRP